ncbi:AAA ATPase-like protein [Fragilaria crotonensis]|nr:AAA ATPase-like protein [Fragilaria crotonensis]
MNKAHADDVDCRQLAADDVSGGFSGAEIISICRDAALLAIEEDDEEMNADNTLMIQMRHLTKAMKATPRQITRAMLDFYESYTNSI